MEKGFEYTVPPEAFKDEAFHEAEKTYPEDTRVYLELTRQVGYVDKVKPSPDGPRIKVKGMGTVPISELRIATEEEIEAWDNRE